MGAAIIARSFMDHFNMSLLDKMDAEFNKNVPPKDSITTKQYAEHMKITREQARTFIGRLVNEGVLEDAGKFGSRCEHHYIEKKK